MTSQISVRTESSLRNQFMEKIKKQGVTATTFFNTVITDYINGKLIFNADYSIEVEEMIMPPHIQALADKLGDAVRKRSKKKK
jgi:antitoxin component of RelBE/YafQ-DinJ toxin-antitoxin module